MGAYGPKLGHGWFRAERSKIPVDEGFRNSLQPPLDPRAFPHRQIAHLNLLTEAALALLCRPFAFPAGCYNWPHERLSSPPTLLIFL